MRFQFDNEKDRALVVNSLRVAAVQYDIDARTTQAQLAADGSEVIAAGVKRVVEQFKRQQRDVLRIADEIEGDGP